MRIQTIDFGAEHLPYRAHENDAGADVYAQANITLKAHTAMRVPLGFGLYIPDGYVGFVCPRSGLSSKGISCELAPIDSGYRGEIHAIMVNNTDTDYQVSAGDRVGQIVILPCIIAEFTREHLLERGIGAFGSTGK